MKITTILPLPAEEWRILKRISVVNDNAKGQSFTIGDILYTRKLNNSYNVKKTDEKRSEVDKYLGDPLQGRYPNDNIDELILQAIKNSNPNSVSRSSLFFTNIDKENLAQYCKRSSEKCVISFIPDFSDLDMPDLHNRKYDGINEPINIYSNYTKESILYLSFTGYFNRNESGVLNKLEQVTFL